MMLLKKDRFSSNNLNVLCVMMIFLKMIPFGPKYICRLFEKRLKKVRKKVKKLFFSYLINFYLIKYCKKKLNRVVRMMKSN